MRTMRRPSQRRGVSAARASSLEHASRSFHTRSAEKAMAPNVCARSSAVRSHQTWWCPCRAASQRAVPRFPHSSSRSQSAK